MTVAARATPPQPQRLALAGIRVTFAAPTGGPDLEILDGVDLEVAAGTLVVVAGRSGSGKTTLLNVAACLLRPSAGEVSWETQPLHRLSSAQAARWRRHNVGMVPQGAGLIDTLTAAENVAMALWGKTGRRTGQEVAAALSRVGVTERAHHWPSQLSGGEQQRVALARAVIGKPPLVIADEPTASLDRHRADALIDLLASFKHDGHAILAASHDPVLIDKADHVAWLE